MLIRAFSAVLISILLVSSSSYASQADKAYKAAKNECSRLQKSEKLKKSGPNWEKVIENFEGFISKYPRDPRVAGAMLTVGDLYESYYDCSKKSEGLNKAIETYSKLAKKFPKNPLADDAVFKTGEIYLKYKKNQEAAYIEFDKVIRKYPKGNMAAKAAGRIKEMSENARAEEPQQAPGASDSGNGIIHVNNIKYWSNPDYTRVVIQADSKVSFKETFKREKEGDKPPRLFLDISESRISKELTKSLTVNDGLLKMVRSGQFDQSTVRVVLDIESIDSYKIFAMENPYRIIIDVSGDKHEPQAVDPIENIVSMNATAFPANTAPVVKNEVAIPKKPSLAQQLSLGIKRVVVDPGHGGHDSGAIGYGGIKEKDIVLEVSKKLRDILTDKLGVEVVMTRDTDVFVELSERTAIANTVSADLFISVHANASRNKKAGGIETYFLNFATDEDSMRLAARENATTTKNIGDLEAILNDLMLNSKINESSKLARFVQGSLLDEVNGNGSRSKDRGVRQAPFYVLIGARMPSILVETSFITNREDAKKLVTEKFQRTLAESIADGVKRYSEIIKVAGR